nr:ubiquitin-conjugating enzyme E2 7 [Tanacetum cinerariifolium]
YMFLLIVSMWISSSKDYLQLYLTNDYPQKPLTVQFTSEFWHPNVYPDGKVCISILHPPGEDPNGYETAMERWNPVHT